MRTVQPFTPRQRDVLAGILRGLTDKEIAAELQCAPQSVKVHIKAVLLKLHVRNRTEAAVKVMRLAISQPCPRCGYVDKPRLNGG